MIETKVFLDKLLHLSYEFAIGVPCSYFKDVLVLLEESKEIKYIIATREDEAVGIATGVNIAKKKVVLFMQNSGFANIGDALTSLAQLYKTPMLIFVSYRGLEADNNFPEHSLMGNVTEPVIKAYNAPYFILEENNWEKQLVEADKKAEELQEPVCLLIKKGVLSR